MSTLRTALLATALAAVATAHAQFATSFEPPLFVNNVSALGTYGFEAGYLGGSVQKVSNLLASQGSQSLLFDNTVLTNTSNSIRQTTLLGASGKTRVTVDVWAGPDNGSGRLAEIRLNNRGSDDSVLSIDGSGVVRAGNIFSGYQSARVSGAMAVIGFASTGTYTGRWLRYVLDHDATTGRVDARISRFGSGPDIATSFTGYTGGFYLELASAANDSASSRGGIVAFDNVNVAPVPEPASMVALGVGVLGVASRRRR